jgi:hypothetical protein
MKSHRLTSLPVLCLTLFGAAIPVTTSAGVIQRTDFCPGEGTAQCGGCPEKMPGTAVRAPKTPELSERRPKNVRDRWKSPHRNLSTSN